MTSSADVERVRQLYEQLMARGCMEDPASAEAVSRFFDPDVEICQMAGILGSAGQFHGHRGVVASTLEVVRDSADPVFIPEEIRALGDQVAAVALFRATGRRSGVPMQRRIGHLFTLREGLIVRFEVFEDPDAALRAAGIVQDDA
jgi:uncharacterized protein